MKHIDQVEDNEQMVREPEHFEHWPACCAECGDVHDNHDERNDNASRAGQRSHEGLFGRERNGTCQLSKILQEKIELI